MKLPLVRIERTIQEGFDMGYPPEQVAAQLAEFGRPYSTVAYVRREFAEWRKLSKHAAERRQSISEKRFG
ncbi:MAG: hypothetical protein WBG19_09495 [Thermoplasmata archaeon]